MEAVISLTNKVRILSCCHSSKNHRCKLAVDGEFHLGLLRDGARSSIYSGPKDSIEVAAQASRLWNVKKLLINDKPMLASRTVKSLGAVIWPNDKGDKRNVGTYKVCDAQIATLIELQVCVYFANANNILTELCQTLKSSAEGWVVDELKQPWGTGFLGRTKKYPGYPGKALAGRTPIETCANYAQHFLDPVAPRFAETSSISAAVIGHSPPRVKIFFSEIGSPDKLACVYSHPDASFPTMWTWGTKFVGDNPADRTIFIPKEKPVPAPTPVPKPNPGYGTMPVRPRDPIHGGRDCNRCPHVILGLGMGFVVGFVAGMILYEPLERFAGTDGHG